MTYVKIYNDMVYNLETHLAANKGKIWPTIDLTKRSCSSYITRIQGAGGCCFSCSYSVITSELGLFQVVHSVTDNPWLFILMLIASLEQDDCWDFKCHVCFQGKTGENGDTRAASPCTGLFPQEVKRISQKIPYGPHGSELLLVADFWEVEQVLVWLSHL